jgi:lipoprotein-anchoring transpeptidase ErfK/SrfK
MKNVSRVPRGASFFANQAAAIEASAANPGDLAVSPRSYRCRLCRARKYGRRPSVPVRWGPQGGRYQAQPSYEPRSLLPPMGPEQAMRRQEDVSEPARPAFDPKYEKQLVEYHGKESPGTIVVDTPNKFLFLVQGDGKALRYGIGVGRPGFTWSGVKTISAKKEWPAWTPPPEMLARRPDLPRHMEGGPQNPLGARAMYLGSSLYRIHGSNEPWTIGTNVSSGCIRMRNDDVIDLYGRVSVGAKVVVI